LTGKNYLMMNILFFQLVKNDGAEWSKNPPVLCCLSQCRGDSRPQHHPWSVFVIFNLLYKRVCPT
jgi:hypothetical protein